MGVAATMRVEAQFTVGVWTDLTPDTVAVDGLRLKYGIDGNGPHDLVAGSGELAFSLRNDPGNSGELLGYYSPNHVNRRSGWEFGVLVRVVFAYDGDEYTKFVGKVAVIDPEPGEFRSKRARVVAYDAIHDLLEADVREMAVQVEKTEAEIIEAALGAVPAEARPLAQAIDPGVDVYPYAADNIGGGRKALALIADVVRSAQGIFVAHGDGTVVYRTRHGRATAATAHAFDNTMVGLEAPSALDAVANVVRVTIHPKEIDPAATTVLWAQTGPATEMFPGQVVELWGDYRDPIDPTVKVGGVGLVTTLVPGTDYAANANADGSGADLTAQLAVTVTAFGTTAKFSVENTGATTLYRTKLQVRGRGIYDLGAQAVESYAARPYGVRALEVDLPYQDDLNVAQGLADYIRVSRQDLFRQIAGLTFLAGDSDAHMLAALGAEPGDVVTVSEAVTGLALVEAFIQSVELEVGAGNWIVCRWGLAPKAAGAVFILDDAAGGLLDESPLGYA